MSTDESPEARRSRERTAEPVDPENFNLRRRLRQIHNAKEQVPETISEEAKRVVDDPRDPGISEERYYELVADAVLNFIIEVEPLMQNDDLDGTDAWDEDPVFQVNDIEYTLKDIVENDGVIETEDGRQPIPISASRKAYRATNRFLSTAGFGVEFDQKMPAEEGFDSTSL
ncbi:hypothetical protein HWV23_02760 [Natronomonas halophila]|uniref:hypothetical protein n=1 Tax=Natronomonas halophila TaxID=2747817 RepID=UPI0015B65672|nr:hypothetical protein [Natronomonas halophila]QLD84623.1 hypothetical protein HWV23_02485 [Natronomonas halophila]QLD84677.1 hypothetical protein HWV23_02760 [Natronomonas halophila]